MEKKLRHMINILSHSCDNRPSVNKDLNFDLTTQKGNELEKYALLKGDNHQRNEQGC